MIALNEGEIHQMTKMKKILSILLLTVMIARVLTGCGGEKTQSFQTIEDFTNARIGILTGSAHDHTAKEKFPEATRVYFNNMADMILAVEQGKIDCYIEDDPFLVPLIWEGVNLKAVNDSLSKMKNGFIFPQGGSVS